ncbi:MAG: MFS transporter, partial [Acidiphilium sp. 37-67-22]
MSATVQTRPQATGRAAMAVLVGVGICHMLNDLLQVLLPAVYPLLKGGFHLNFAQIGLITLVYQATGSLLQPLVGLYTDARPLPYSLPVGMALSMSGIVT